MKTYPDEVAAARWYSNDSQPPTLSEAQRREWAIEAKARLEWSLAHPHVHNALNVTLFAGLLAADALVCWLGPQFTSPAAPWWWPAGLGLLHGWLLYHFTSVSLHEGAGHNRLIIGRSGASRALRGVLNNVCRLGFADPEYYRTRHPSHHKSLGTERDGAFTHLVRPGRVLLSFLPFAALLPFADYRIHAAGPSTRSRALTDGLSVVWLSAPMCFAAMSMGWARATFMFVVIAPWVAFSCDRLRETVDHALLPTDRLDAARSLGLGLWGVLLAPGPWGQCSHLVHHLFPALPWYQQVLLHRRVARELTDSQRRTYLLGSMGALLLRIARETRTSLRAVRGERGESGSLTLLMTFGGALFIVGCLAIALVPAGVIIEHLLTASSAWWRWSALPCAWLSYGLTLSVISVVSRWLLLPRMRVGEFANGSAYIWRWGIVHRLTHLTQSSFITAFRGTPLINAWFRALGMRIGRGVVINSADITDWSLVTIGDDAVVGYGVGVQAHSAERGFVRFRCVHIGAGVVLGRNAMVFEGTRLDDTVSLAPGSVALPAKRLRVGAPWAGVPARQPRRTPRGRARR